MSRDLLYLALAAATGTIGFLVGQRMGKSDGFEEGVTIGRVRQMVKEGYSLQDINRILRKDMAEEDIEHF